MCVLWKARHVARACSRARISSRRGRGASGVELVVRHARVCQFGSVEAGGVVAQRGVSAAFTSPNIPSISGMISSNAPWARFITDEIARLSVEPLYVYMKGGLHCVCLRALYDELLYRGDQYLRRARLAQTLDDVPELVSRMTVCTATHSGSSSGTTVGDFRPGVICTILSSAARGAFIMM